MQNDNKQPTAENPTGRDMYHPEINMGNMINEQRASANFIEQYTKDFPTLLNLVDAVPKDIDPDVPFVADTTVSGLVHSIPRDSLEQLPVFSAVVNGTKYSVNALLCSYLLKKYVFNEDTFGKGLLSTLQIGAEQALTLGFAGFFAATGEMFNDLGSTLRLLHFTDHSPEPGIQDHNQTGYDYMVANLTPSRVQKMLKQAKANPDTSWNVRGLEAVLSMPPKPKNYSIYESTVKQNKSAEDMGATYQFITRYEVGPESTIITYCPDYPEAPLRVLDNKSKWGYPRVLYLVIDPAGLSPFGTSRVRVASPIQNLLNIYTGNIAAMLLLNSKPPVFKKGRFTSRVELKQGVVWETNDPNADAVLKNLDNGSLEFFPQMRQELAGQIQNIMGGQTATVNASAKGGAFGKTGPGIKAGQQVQDSQTNQVTKILENFLRQYGSTGLDAVFLEHMEEAEMDDEGNMDDTTLIVDDDTKNALNQIEAGFVGDDNKVAMNWKQLYEEIEEWSVEVTVSISKDELDEKKRADMQDMLVVLAQNAQELGPEAVADVRRITNMLMQKQAPLAPQLSNQPPAIPAPGAMPAAQPPAAPDPQAPLSM